MFVKTIRLICVLAFAAALIATGIAQEKKQEKENVETTGFKGKIFELKHREPSEIYQTISPLGSGFKGAVITINDELNMLTVRDFPENIAVIEEAIKRLDVSRTSRAESNVELSLQVLLANTSEIPNQLPGELPNDLKDVAKQLQNTFTFKNYILATTIVQRAKTNGRFRGGNALYGTGDSTWTVSYKRDDGSSRDIQEKANYEYRITAITVAPGVTGPSTIQLQNFFFRFGQTRVQTDLDVRDGEKLVVGTASYETKAMILVLTAKIPK